MIPKAMKQHLDSQTLLMNRTDLTYQKLRIFLMDHCAAIAPLLPTLMDETSSFDKDDTGKEAMDSFGKGPKGGGVGKGGDSGKGKDPKDKSDANKCNICGRLNHWARE